MRGFHSIRFIYLILIVSLGSILIWGLIFLKDYDQTKKILGASRMPNLDQLIKSELKDADGQWAMVIKNFKNGEEFKLNEHQSFNSGSLYKLWVMAETYNQIKLGLLDEDQTIEESINVLNNKFGISPDQAELDQGAINFTVNSALHQMITISHNYAALILIDRVKLSNVKKFLEKNNFNESSVSTTGDELPTTSAFDMAIFMEKLYNNELSDTETTAKMLNLLKAQTLNNKLPLYLPPDIQIAHKTGEIEWSTHDVGIVFTNRGDYIIVVLSDSPSPKLAEEKIGKLSKAVYEYFMR